MTVMEIMIERETRQTAVSAFDGQNSMSADDQALMPKVVEAVKEAGKILFQRFSTETRPGNLTELLASIKANDEASEVPLRRALLAVRPDAHWVEDEEAGGLLPMGEWWVADPAEGNVNHIHGMADWAVTATLVRDNKPVLTAVYLPVADTIYTAVQGRGAYQDSVRLHVSLKPNLDAALVGTGQAKPSEDRETYRRIGESITAMLGNALLVRASVPATLAMIQVAAGRMEAFWQYSQVRSGLLAGALLVSEAGGLVTDTHGAPWTLESNDLLASTSGVHAATMEALSTIQ
jgi:myo-inositol-1(or 4)-monophosphatase